MGEIQELFKFLISWTANEAEFFLLLGTCVLWAVYSYHITIYMLGRALFVFPASRSSLDVKDMDSLFVVFFSP